MGNNDGILRRAFTFLNDVSSVGGSLANLVEVDILEGSLTV
jgi:hypothetical protein